MTSRRSFILTYKQKQYHSIHHATTRPASQVPPPLLIDPKDPRHVANASLSRCMDVYVSSNFIGWEPLVWQTMQPSHVNLQHARGVARCVGVAGVICFSSFCCCSHVGVGILLVDCLWAARCNGRHRASLAPPSDDRDAGGKVSRVLCMCDVARDSWYERVEKKKKKSVLSRVRITLQRGTNNAQFVKHGRSYGWIIPYHITHPPTLASSKPRTSTSMPLTSHSLAPDPTPGRPVPVEPQASSAFPRKETESSEIGLRHPYHAHGLVSDILPLQLRD